MNANNSSIALDPVAEMASAFAETMQWFLTTPAMRTVIEGRLTLNHYKSVLREIYHYTKEDPQIQAYASVYFRGADREMVKPFLRHAISEIGHEMLALNDLKMLGGDVTGIERSNPLPATIAFTAYGFYNITFGNPVAYLGYLYFLEYLPTQYGQVFGKALMDAGVPVEAMTFLQDHQTVDAGHNQAMVRYLQALIQNRKDLEDTIYSMRVTASLYANLYQEALARVSKPSDFGTAWCEVARFPGSWD